VIVVSDTTPLSELAKIGRLELLQDIFGQVVVPEEVYEELMTGIHPAISQVKAATWIMMLSVTNAQSVQSLQEETLLGLGESAAIVLAEELAAEQLLLDDLDARRVAKARNLPVVGTLGVVVSAKR
jgi:predicted nucleic acid-binding protein